MTVKTENATDATKAITTEEAIKKTQKLLEQLLNAIDTALKNLQKQEGSFLNAPKQASRVDALNKTKWSLEHSCRELRSLYDDSLAHTAGASPGSHQ